MFQLKNGFIGMINCFNGKVIKLFNSSTTRDLEKKSHFVQNYLDFGNNKKWNIFGKQKPTIFNYFNNSFVAVPSFSTPSVLFLDWNDLSKQIYLENYDFESSTLSTLKNNGDENDFVLKRLETSCLPVTTLNFDQNDSSFFCGSVGDSLFQIDLSKYF